MPQRPLRSRIPNGPAQGALKEPAQGKHLWGTPPKAAAPALLPAAKHPNNGSNTAQHTQSIQTLSCTVYAKPFPLNVTEAQVNQAFGRFGRVTKVKFRHIVAHDEPMESAYVTFETAEAAQMAVADPPADFTSPGGQERLMVMTIMSAYVKRELAAQSQLPKSKHDRAHCCEILPTPHANCTIQ